MEINEVFKNKAYKLYINQFDGKLSIESDNNKYYGQWIPLFDKLVMVSSLDREVVSFLEEKIKNDPRKDNIRLSLS
jgi:hypothetical protein